MDEILFSIDDKIYTRVDYNLWNILNNIPQNNEQMLFNCGEIFKNVDSSKQKIEDRIDEILILKDASKLGISNFIKKIEITEKLNNFKNRFRNIDEYNLFLECLGISETKLFQIFGDSVIINKYKETRIKSQIEIYPVEIELYFKRHKKNYSNNTLIEVEPLIKPIILNKKFEQIRFSLIGELKKNARINRGLCAENFQ